MEGSVSISKCAKFSKKFTEGNARKVTVNFTFFGYADVIKCQENHTISCERAQITTAHIISVRGHKTIESHLKYSRGRRGIWSSEAQTFLPWGLQPPWTPDKNADSG